MTKVAVILAGGKGTRLGKDGPPKAMLKVGKKTLLDLQLEWLKSEGFGKVILCLGYKSDEVKYNVQDLFIHKSVEREPLGTGGAVKNAYNTYPELFVDGVLVLNVDDIARYKTDEVFSQLDAVPVCKEIPFSVIIHNTFNPQNSALQHIGHSFLPESFVKKLPPIGSLEECYGYVRPYTEKDLFWTTANTKEQLKLMNAEWRKRK